jgi:hypothetical protein
MRPQWASKGIFVAVMLTALVGCAGPEVIGGRGPDTLPRAAARSLVIVIKDNPETARTKHQPGSGLGKPVFTPDEVRSTDMRCREIAQNLAQHLIPQAKARLAPYLAGTEPEIRHTLTVEISRIAADTDGSADIRITLSYNERGERFPAWMRIVRTTAGRFSTPDAITNEVMEAVLAQLKASALIPA